MEKCKQCGYTTGRHLLHASDGQCYCTAHYLLHILHDNKDEGLYRERNRSLH